MLRVYSLLVCVTGGVSRDSLVLHLQPLQLLVRLHNIFLRLGDGIVSLSQKSAVKREWKDQLTQA